MDSVMLHLHTGVVVQFPASIASTKQQQLKAKTTVFSPKERGTSSNKLVFLGRHCRSREITVNQQFENVHVTSLFRPGNGHNETSSSGIKRSQSPRRLSASEKTDADVSKTSPSSDEKVVSVKQEEVISLFKRIQSSISKADSVSNEKKGTNPNQKKPAAQSVLEVIRRSRKQGKDEVSLKGGNKPKPRRSFLKEVEDVEPILTPMKDIKLTRPPSNFVRKSPIPFPSSPRGKEDQWNEAPPAIAKSNDSTLQKLEGMKLQELKELAKSRGVRGYSRLKKKELVELLRS